MRKILLRSGMAVLLGVILCFAAWAKGWHLFEGFSGMVVTIFLAYCAIIVVFQVVSALAALRSYLEGLHKEKPTSRRINVR